MKNYLTIVLAGALIVSTGIVHGFWSHSYDFILGKQSHSEKLVEFSTRLQNVPEIVGNWVGADLKPMDGREREVAGIDGSLQRAYQNKRTKESSSVFLVSGHHRDVAQHTPDQCYVAAGFEMMGKPIKYRIETPKGTVEAYTTVFKKDDHTSGTHYQRVFWTWSVDGNWVAPDSPRLEFVNEPALYKMYIISALEQPGRSITEDSSLAFAHEFIPVLNDTLFGAGNAAGVGSDPQDALEPVPATDAKTPESTEAAPADAAPAIPAPVAPDAAPAP